MNDLPSTISELDDEDLRVAKAQAELAQRRRLIAAARQELAESTPAHLLAIELHERMCHVNHTDGCCWYYAVTNGRHDWNNYSHRTWLAHAQRVINRLECEPVTPDNVVEFIKKLAR